MKSNIDNSAEEKPNTLAEVLKLISKTGGATSMEELKKTLGAIEGVKVVDATSDEGKDAASKQPINLSPEELQKKKDRIQKNMEKADDDRILSHAKRAREILDMLFKIHGGSPDNLETLHLNMHKLGEIIEGCKLISRKDGEDLSPDEAALKSMHGHACEIGEAGVVIKNCFTAMYRAQMEIEIRDAMIVKLRAEVKQLRAS